MGLIQYGSATILGNFTKARRYKNGRPRNWIDRDYKAIVPFDFKWRTKLGKVECDCVEVIEAYMWYGWNYYHSNECAIMKHYRKYPQMANLGVDPSCFARSE